MLRPEFVRRKLHLIVEELARLDRYREVSHDELVGDFVVQATVERLVERIVMRAIDVNQHLLAEADAELFSRTARLTYRDTFLMLAELGVLSEEFAEAIAPSAGLRNVLVHDYNDVDRRLLHAAITTCLRQYPHYVAAVEQYLDAQTG